MGGARARAEARMGSAWAEAWTGKAWARAEARMSTAWVWVWVWLSRGRGLGRGKDLGRTPPRRTATLFHSTPSK